MSAAGIGNPESGMGKGLRVAPLSDPGPALRFPIPESRFPATQS
jgi:hypothetical protein